MSAFQSWCQIRLGVFACLLLATERTAGLGLGFQNDEREAFFIQQQEINNVLGADQLRHSRLNRTPLCKPFSDTHTATPSTIGARECKPRNGLKPMI